MQSLETAVSDDRQHSGATELRVSGMTCANCARRVTEAIQSVAGVRSATISLENKTAVVHWNPGSTRNISALVEAVKLAGYKAGEISAEGCGASRTCHEGRQKNWHFNLLLGVTVTAALMAGEWIFNLGVSPWFCGLAFGLAGVVQVFCGAQFYAGAWRQFKIGQSNMDTLVALGSTTAFAYSAWALLAGVGGHLYFMEAAAIITLISLGHWLEARVSDMAGVALKSLMQLAPQTARRISPLPAGREEGRVPNEDEVEVPISELRIADLVALRPGDCVPVDGVVLEGKSAVDEAMLTGESVPVDKQSGGELFAGTVNLNGRLIMRVTATGEATALARIIAAVQRAQSSHADIQRLGDRVSSVFVPAVVAIAVAAGLWWGLAPESANRVHEFLARIFWHSHVPAGLAAGFIIAAAVLIVACPCAMGLATPIAIMAGANAAARRGILIRDGVALEKAGKITAVVFDKTGTITEGRPEVVMSASFSPHPNPLPRGEGTGSAYSFSSNDLPANPAAGLQVRQDTILPLPAGEGRGEGSEVKRIAAALAGHSTHPISQAIAKLDSEGGVPRRPDSTENARDSRSSSLPRISDWKEIRGAGVEGNIQHSTFNIQNPTAKVRLGSLSWLKESGVDLAVGEKFTGEWTDQGATIVGLAEEKKLLALFAVRDTVKSSAAKVIEQLQRKGLKIFLVTGDHSKTAASIAGQVGIAAENVFAEVRPEQKAEFVKKLQARGERVAFVGDGINDAPALTQSDLGIAVSRASEIAREAADIILLRSEIEAVPEALGLAHATLRTIKQNLFWAFFYNALGVPLAALGFISPIFCAAAMGVSDLVVIGNALRLLRWRK